MLRVIFDTNIYARLAIDRKAHIITEKILNDQNFIIYGFPIIRKELRDTPKSLMLGRLSERNLLLSLYDKLTKEKVLNDNAEVTRLANNYYDKSKELGANLSWDAIKNDFLIVACATVNKLDVVVSEDSKMINDKRTLAAFEIINDKENLRTPNFWEYKRLVDKYQ